MARQRISGQLFWKNTTAICRVTGTGYSLYGEGLTALFLEGGMFHYTDDSGYKAIASHGNWLFKASQPPGPHPKGAYFTNLIPRTPNLAQKLRVPKAKLAFIF
jgi:hypothetical protein